LPESSWLDPFFLPLIEQALRSLSASFAPESRLLHVGCSTGVKSEALRRLGYRVTGIDIEPRHLEAARKRFPELELIEVDAHQLPFGDAAFDVVFSFSTLQMMQNRSRVLAECARVLKPGGRAVFIENMAGHLLARGYRALGRSEGSRRSYRTYDYIAPHDSSVFHPWFEGVELVAFHLFTPAVLAVPALANALWGRPMRIQSLRGYRWLARVDRAVLPRSGLAQRHAWHVVATMSRARDQG
jgi:SAM-dependent methyltransferase